MDCPRQPAFPAMDATDKSIKIRFDMHPLYQISLRQLSSLVTICTEGNINKKRALPGDWMARAYLYRWYAVKPPGRAELWRRPRI